MRTSEGPQGANEGYWVTRTWWLLGILLLVRVGYLLIFPVDLAGDESYYWDWSRRLDWAYYSKPPLVAWIIWLGTLGGDTLFFLKLPAALLNVGTTAVLGLLARRLYSARAGFWTIVASATMPGTILSGMTMTIDAPLLFCWATALLCTAHSLGLTLRSNQTHQAAWGIAAAVAVGCGLLAKLSMGIFWIGLVFLWLFPGQQHQRPSLKRWIPLAILSACSLIPFLIWNWRRHWITFEHTSTSFGVERWSFLDAFGRGWEYVGSQLGALHPIWWVAMMIIALLSILRWRTLDPRTRFLAAFSTPFVLGALLLAFYQRVQPNWPAAFYLASTVILGCLLSGQKPFRTHNTPSLDTSGQLPLWGKIGTWLGITLVVLLYITPFALERTGYAGHRMDPFARIRGWQSFAQEVQQLREQTFSTPTSDSHFIWVGGHRYPTSQLAFYLPDQPRMYRYEPSGLIYSQYEMWPSPAQDGLAGHNALLLLPPELVEEQLPEWSQYFERVTPLGLVRHEIGNGRILQMNAFHGVRLKE
jgi:4-amino-4-deoxy-L-arabinose transferase-like glycosyltransferase